MGNSASVLLTPSACCLVLVDIQEKLAAVMSDKEKMIARCSILLRTAKALNIPVLWCEQAPRALGSTVRELRELLEGEKPFEKTSFSCCGAEGFFRKLESTQSSAVLLCGIEAHVCVFQTAVELLNRGLNVHVIADAVSSRTEENKAIGLGRMSAAGAVINSTEMVLFELLRDARHERFKELAALIK
ncbi:MAG TPA: hydrolase [Anaerohalosphaeraceae bacterium]|nr:hydrolase [Anaerohalosphaeraceae bacterium]